MAGLLHGRVCGDDTEVGVGVKLVGMVHLNFVNFWTP